MRRQQAGRERGCRCRCRCGCGCGCGFGDCNIYVPEMGDGKVGRSVGRSRGRINRGIERSVERGEEIGLFFSGKKKASL